MVASAHQAEFKSFLRMPTSVITILVPHIGQVPPFGHLKYLARSLFNSHQTWYMTSNTLYNHYWHVIFVWNLVFYEIKNKLFVTHAEYAATEFDFRKCMNRIIGLSGV